MGNARLKSCRLMEPCVRFFVPCITDVIYRTQKYG